MLRLLLSMFIVSTGISVTSGQTAKEFFFPDSSYNKATFFQPDQSGEQSGMTRSIYYVRKGNDYHITDAHFFHQQPTAIITQKVVVDGSTVKMTQSVMTNALGTTNQKTTYNPAVILFKIPSKGQTATWTMKEKTATTTCTATWTTVTIDGEVKEAIKVKKQLSTWKAYTQEYYVKNIGLWQNEIVSGNRTQVFDKFEELEYDATGD